MAQLATETVDLPRDQGFNICIQQIFSDSVCVWIQIYRGLTLKVYLLIYFFMLTKYDGSH
jgi:hypothetical protein